MAFNTIESQTFLGFSIFFAIVLIVFVIVALWISISLYKQLTTVLTKADVILTPAANLVSNFGDKLSNVVERASNIPENFCNRFPHLCNRDNSNDNE